MGQNLKTNSSTNQQILPKTQLPPAGFLMPKKGQHNLGIKEMKDNFFSSQSQRRECLVQWPGIISAGTHRGIRTVGSFTCKIRKFHLYSCLYMAFFQMFDLFVILLYFCNLTVGFQIVCLWFGKISRKGYTIKQYINFLEEKM